MKSEIGLQQLKQLFPNIDFDFYSLDKEIHGLITRTAFSLGIFDDINIAKSILESLQSQKGPLSFSNKSVEEQLKIFKSYITAETKYRNQYEIARKVGRPSEYIDVYG